MQTEKYEYCFLNIYRAGAVKKKKTFEFKVHLSNLDSTSFPQTDTQMTPILIHKALGVIKTVSYYYANQSISQSYSTVKCTDMSNRI